MCSRSHEYLRSMHSGYDRLNTPGANILSAHPFSPKRYSATFEKQLDQFLTGTSHNRSG
jgi:hypothetical protein